MKKCLVTGGAGFIGSHLCDFLIEKGFGVVCADNLITGSLDNISHLRKNKSFSFVNIDVSKDEIREGSFDYIFHLASPASPVHYQNFPEETATVNSLGTMKMLKLAKKTGSKILIASTSEVYGDPLKHPQSEDYWGNVNSFGPRSCYDESKRFAETLSYIYLKKYDLDIRIVRIFNTYGPRMQKNDGRVVSNFIIQALKNEPLTIYGDGKQTRSFCFVSDLVKGIHEAMFRSSTKGEIFNLGNPEEYRVLELAEKICKITGNKKDFVYGDLPEDDPMQRCPDISKAKNSLGWEPEVSVDEGLLKTISFYKKDL